MNHPSDWREERDSAAEDYPEPEHEPMGREGLL